MLDVHHSPLTWICLAARRATRSQHALAVCEKLRITQVGMPALPPLPPGQKRNPAPADRSHGVAAGVGGSSVSSNRDSNTAERPQTQSGRAPSEKNLDDARSQCSGASRRSKLATSLGHGSQRSTGGASTAGRSITSSVALSKLQQLEDMLLEERRAREQAELTLLKMQKQKLERDDKLDKGAAAQRQLAEVMGALQTVLAEPHDAGGIAKLRNIVRGAPVRSAPRSSGGGTSHLGVEGAGSNPVRTASAQEPRSFLDNIGSFDRERQKRGGKRAGVAGY
jgi:hypothetical protein